MPTDSPSPRAAWRHTGALGAASTGLGGSVASLVVGVCCVSPVIAPLVVGILGASGAAWAAGWKPYAGVLLLASGVLLAVSFWLIYRPRVACLAGETDVHQPVWGPRIAKIVVWAGAVFWGVALLVRVVFG